jgi:hypothetical protein
MDLIYFHGFLFQIFDDIDIYSVGTKLSIYDHSSVEGFFLTRSLYIKISSKMLLE